MPTTYVANELAIEYVNGLSESETGYHYRIDRTFQLVYFGTSALDCVMKVAPVERLFNNARTIPLKGTTRYLRIGSFSLSQAFKTESGVYAIIGMLAVSLREARDQPTYTKIGAINTRTYTDKTISTWAVIDGSETPDITSDGYTWESVESGQTFVGTTPIEGGFTWSDIESGKTVFTEGDK